MVPFELANMHACYDPTTKPMFRLRSGIKQKHGSIFIDEKGDCAPIRRINRRHGGHARLQLEKDGQLADPALPLIGPLSPFGLSQKLGLRENRFLTPPDGALSLT